MKKAAPASQPDDAEVERLRKALRDFMSERGLVRTTWCKESGVSESTLRWFLSGRTRSMNDITYRKLAANQNVSMAVLRGEVGPKPKPNETPIRSYVGAGAEVIPFDGDDPIDWVAAPPGTEVSGGGFVVRGDSMLPMFRDGDILFPEPHPVPPERRVGSIVILDLKDGRRLVKKLIRGGRRDRWTLISVNPVEPPIENQDVVRCVGIPWVQRKV